MNRYLKLVHMEIYRFRYILAGLMAFTAIFQISGFVHKLLLELSERDRIGVYPSNELLSFARIIAHSQFWSIIPMLLCAAVMFLYIFFIWYRDWFGRSTFIYRLLMLPTARSHIYWAKATAILLFVFSLLSFQLLVLLVQKLIFNLAVPASQRVEPFFTELLRANQAFDLLFPYSFEQFVYTYGLGMFAVFAIFTAIIIERSYRGIGILYGIIYLTISVMAVLLPPYFMGIDGSAAYLYPGEILTIEVLICGLVLSASLFIGTRLLSRKISV